MTIRPSGDNGAPSAPSVFVIRRPIFETAGRIVNKQFTFFVSPCALASPLAPSGQGTHPSGAFFGGKKNVFCLLRKQSYANSKQKIRV